MKTKIQYRLFGSFFLALIVAQMSSPISSSAQILSHGDLFGPGAPPPMVGIQVGVGQHSELGTMQCNCGSQFTGGNGKGFLGSLLFELPIDYEWAVGIKGGIDFKNFSTQTPVNEEVSVVLPDSQLLTQSESVYRTANVKSTYIDIAPYVQYQFYRMGPFVQAGLNFGFLAANNLTQSRQLPAPVSATVNGVTYNDLVFSNGTLEEQIQSGPQSVSSLRLGLLLSAGYNIQVSERSIFSPLITYDLPLNAAGTIPGFGWKIGSLYASALLKFQL